MQETLGVMFFKVRQCIEELDPRWNLDPDAATLFHQHRLVEELSIVGDQVDGIVISPCTSCQGQEIFYPLKNGGPRHVPRRPTWIVGDAVNVGAGGRDVHIGMNEEVENVTFNEETGLNNAVFVMGDVW